MLDYFKKMKAQDSYFYQKIELSKFHNQFEAYDACASTNFRTSKYQ